MTKPYCAEFGRGTYAASPSRVALVDAARARDVVDSATAPTAAVRSTARRVSPIAAFASSFRLRLIIISLLLWCAAAAPAGARHLARTDPTEPIFSQRAFVEKNLELDASWDKSPGSNAIGLASGVSWVFWKRLELDLDIPVGVQIPQDGATVGSLDDVEVGAQFLLYNNPNGLLDYLSVRADAAAPTGNQSKNIGGTGSWTLSLLPARRFTIVERLPDVFVSLQLAYMQDIHATDAAPGEGSVRQKAFVWNTALLQQYWDGRIRPVLELLGTTVAQAADSGDEHTVVEIATGLWVVPFPDAHVLSALSIGMGWKWPVVRRLDSELTGLLILEWSFGT